MQLKNMNEIFVTLERMIKAGLIHCVLRDEREVGSAIEGEMIIDYTFDPKAPVLKVIRKGVPEFLYTESDRLFREFRDRVFQVGTEPTGDGYSPSIYFKIDNGTNNNSGFDKDTVTSFYNEFKNDPNIKPYIKHVKNNEGEYVLYPFTDSDHIYLDISEIFNTDNQDVRSITDVFGEIWRSVVDIKNALETSINTVSETMSKITKDFNDVDVIQNDLLNTLDDTNKANLEAIKNLKNEFDALLADVEGAIRPIDFKLTHMNGDVVVPVLFTLSGGRDIANGIKELFLASLYIVDRNCNQYTKIGSDILNEGGDFTSSDLSLEWTTRRKDNITVVYDCKQVSNNQFVVLMRTGEYRIYNKYIDSTSIVPKPDGYAGYTVQSATHVYNKMINGPGWTGPMFRKFSSALIVTDKLILGNMSLKIGK